MTIQGQESAVPAQRSGTGATHPGLEALSRRPVLETIYRRRTHRVSRGSSVSAGSLSYRSPHEREPLTPLEEAVLIALTGSTGVTMPDRPLNDPHTGQPIMAKPNLTMAGRTAGSPDNAQGTHFFLINDTGTYFLRHLPPPDPADDRDQLSAEVLLERAEQAKVCILDHRLDVTDRDFPAYLDSNRFLSNLPGTTIMFPVVDLSHQYINALMYLLTQPEGCRPTIVDDRNLYQPAGVKAWVKKGFLNKDLKIPLGALGMMRTQIEADLLLQNLMLGVDAMGLGAWIHASITPAVAVGDPKFRGTYGRMLGFQHATPRWRPLDALRWQVPVPWHANLRAHPVALRHRGEYLIKAMTPPNYPSTDEAVDAVVAGKFGPTGVYRDDALFRRIYKGGYGPAFLAEAGDYAADVIDCARDICRYIYATHGRFPAHCDAIHVPGVWLQAHHVENEYYDRFFADGLTTAHREHDAGWH
jgi:hypothetical protein